MGRGNSCLFGEWRSVGSPPPDKAVWGHPSYVIPVWRYVITNTTERILTGPVSRSILMTNTTEPPASGAQSVRTYTIFELGLEIPMAVSDAGYARYETAVDVGPTQLGGIASLLRWASPRQVIDISDPAALLFRLGYSAHGRP